MNKTIRNIAVLVVSAFALGQGDEAWAADANPPERMTYQGYLVDGNGAPLGDSVPANYDVVFRIYNVKQGGTSVWAEQQTVTVDNGYFSVLLGEGSQFGSESHGVLSAVFDGADASDRFIGITVGGLGGTDVEIAPRLLLVSSPFAFTATQARRLTDGSGNANFFKDGASLKLGAGSTPTLTLPEAGGASLEGKLTINLSGDEVGLEINNGVSSTTLGAENTSHFHFKTDRGGFYFNKELRVFGDIHSQNADTVLGPSNNTDTYLKISSSSDKITAQADEFLVQGDSKYLHMKFTTSAAELRTNASKFYMNKPLEVEDSVSVDGGLSAGSVTITKPNNDEAVLSLRGSGTQGTGRLYVGQSASHGGGIIYNGDASPAFAGSTEDAISFYRTSGSVHHEVFKYMYNSDNVEFNGKVIANSTVKAPGLQSRVFYSYQDGNKWFTVEPYGTQDGVAIANKSHNNGSIGTSSKQWDDGYITELWASVQGSDRRIKKDITPVQKNELLEMIDEMSFYQYRLRFSREDKMKRQGRDADGFFYGIMAQELREIYPNVVKSSGLAVELDENEEDEEKIEQNHWYVEKDRLAELALGGVKDLYTISKEKEVALDSLINRNQALEIEVETLKSEMAVLKARLANSTTQENRIAKLEELVRKIGQGE
ncbi:tail fiber domain-containing protein [bacterium]|nr:tail fiber domain-containing protein [bacterium]